MVVSKHQEDEPGSWISSLLAHRATKAELALSVEAPQVPVMGSLCRATFLASLLPLSAQPLSMSPQNLEPRCALARLTLTPLKTQREHSAGQTLGAAINSDTQRSRKLNQLQIFSYLGHVVGIRHNKHSRRRLLVNGHDIPGQRKRELVRIPLGIHQLSRHGTF